MTTLSITATHEILTCGECGIEFAVPSRWVTQRRNNHKTWYCPNGHRRHYPSENKEEQLRSLLQKQKAVTIHLRDQLDSATKSRNAYKGHLNRTKKRIKNGVCPCCNRSFKDLARHMGNKHPNYSPESSHD